MKMLLKVTFCCCLTAAAGMAQHGGGGGGARGGGGGGFRGGGGGGFSHGGFGGGGFRGGSGFRGFGGFGSFGGFSSFGGFRSFGFRGGFGFYNPYIYSGYGLGYGYGPGYYDSGYDSYPAYSYPAYGSSYQPSSNVTVVYPPASQSSTVYAERPNPVLREYDQYGQQIAGPAAGGPGAMSGPATPPVYLIAFRDHTIRAAVAYWVEGNAVHYVSLEHESKQAPLDSIDRDLSRQLNSERRVPFSLSPR